MAILLLAEHDNATLKAATLNVVTAASAIGGDIDILVAGQNCRPGAEAAAKISGIAKVLVADDAAYANGLRERRAIDRQAGARRRLHPRAGAVDDLWQKHHAARRRPA